MNTSFQSAILIVLVTLCVFVSGNYITNMVEEMPAEKNWRETQMWGAGFVIYAVLDYLVLIS